MFEHRSPNRICYTLFVAGIPFGMLLNQIIWLAAGKNESPLGMNGIWFLISMALFAKGRQMVASLPWGYINDPTRYEYRNPYGPSKTVGDGGEKDFGSVPSQNPAPEDLER